MQQTITLRTAITNPDITTRFLLQHKSEILGTHAGVGAVLTQSAPATSIAARIALAVPIGHGHYYAPEHYIDAWVAVTDPQGWTPEDIATLFPRTLGAPDSDWKLCARSSVTALVPLPSGIRVVHSPITIAGTTHR